MAPRAQWKGYLKLSLVSCPVALYPAISPAERVSFRQVNRQTGNRLKQQLVDSVTGDVVATRDKGRGYEVGQNQFLMVEDEELQSAREEAKVRPYTGPPITKSSGGVEEAAPEQPAPRRRPMSSDDDTTQRREAAPSIVPPPPPPVIIENNRTIEIERFVPREQIDARYHDTPYYIAPRDQVGLEAFAVIRDAMLGKEMVGMGRVILAKRERPIIVEPLGRGLRGMTLRYTHEVRSEAEYFADIPPMELPKEMLRLAEHILETKTADFDPALLEDRYRTVLIEVLRTKQADLPRVPDEQPATPENVVSLMDALKRSLAAERASPAATAMTTARRTRKPAPASPVKRPNVRARKAGS